MDVNILISKWEEVSDHKNLKGYKALRISSECVPDLFIATDEEGFRCLLLFLPEATKITINGTEKENLNLVYLNSQNVILIRLNDSDFFDLFNDLIVSLYSRIEKISNPTIYANELITSFYKWSEFFEDKRSSKLTSEQIKGLIGELFILINLIHEDDQQDINRILESWKGPFNQKNDFIFDAKNIEVKTKEKSKQTVTISSEYQLETEFDKGLELVVVSVQKDLVKGLSIHDLVKDVVSMIRSKYGDLSIFYNAIRQLGLTVESSIDYNNYRYIIESVATYNCVDAAFPKLSFSNVPSEISNLYYDLRITTLNEFLISEKKY